MNTFFKLFTSSIAALFLFSCKSGRTLQDVTYLNQGGDSTLYSKVMDFEPVIQKGDRLTITVNGLNPESAAQFNQAVPSSGGATTAAAGYVVESDGTINFPQLGKIKVEGLTRESLVKFLIGSLVKYVMTPVVTVQIINFKISVLGEVSRPGTFNVPDGKINIIEAVGLSGDLTITGRRENILVIREKNGKRELGRVNLTTTNVFSSPYYNLQQNDVVYVEMTTQKIKTNEQAEFRNNLGLASTLISLASTIVILIVTLTR